MAQVVSPGVVAGLRRERRMETNFGVVRGNYQLGIRMSPKDARWQACLFFPMQIDCQASRAVPPRAHCGRGQPGLGGGAFGGAKQTNAALPKDSRIALLGAASRKI